VSFSLFFFLFLLRNLCNRATSPPQKVQLLIFSAKKRSWKTAFRTRETNARTLRY
jgi:hypothetical protein